VIYPGIEVSRFNQVSPATGKTIFTAGQLNKYYKFDVIIRSFARFKSQFDNSLSLEIGGTGQYKQQLKEIAIEEGVDDEVKFLGYLSDSELVSRYAQAMATVYLPKNEPFGLVPIESMAAGTPVIAMDSGGIKETVVDGKTGLLVSTASEREVSNAFSELFNSPNLRESMGTAGKERAISTFSLQHTVDQLADVFLNID
jgi:glycosyltransferase involved in cell wall biosynthesis